jgi:hypothetical protein
MTIGDGPVCINALNSNMKKKNWKLAAYFYAFSLLSGCADNAAQITSNVPTIPLEQVISRCLSTVAPQGGPTPTQDNLTESQWIGYVTCALGSNLRVDIDEVHENPQATVEILIDDDGSIDSVRRFRTSGNAAWDRAVDISIRAAPALAPAPNARHFSKLYVVFGPFLHGIGANGGATLTGQSHWSTHHCTTAGGATVCN